MSDQHDSNPGSENELFDDPENLSEEDLAEDQPGDALEIARQEIDGLNDKILRLAAELENTRRRAEREKIDAGKYAISGFARDLIGVLDNFERALRVADDAETASVTVIADGLRMTEKEMLSALSRHGVERVFPAAEKFDPNLHQAVAQVPHGSIPSGHVVDVAQPGFTIGGRVLRAAMVTVSSGPGENAAPSSESNAPTDGQGPRLDTKV